MSEEAWGAAERLGLGTPTESGSAFGVVRGYPAQISVGSRGVLEVVRFDGAAETHALREAIRTRADVLEREETGWRYVQASEGTLAYERSSAESSDQVVEDVELLLALLEGLGIRPTDECDLCDASVERPLLLNGVVTRICDGCLQRLDEDVQAARLAAQHPTADWGAVAVRGTVAFLGGAAVWGGVVVATSMMVELLAAAIGVVIGVVTRHAAGFGSTGITAFGAGLTVLAILTGQLGVCAYGLAASGDVPFADFPFALPLAVLATFDDWSYALGAALVGAWLSVVVPAIRPEFTVVPELVIER